MDNLWRTTLWKQFGATIDMLENALLACPSTLWQEHLWSGHSEHPPSSQFDAFWLLTHHTLFWLDFNLTGSLEGFTPPTPFTVDGQGAPERIRPEQPYTREELHAYLVRLRQKCHTTLLPLSDEQARFQAVYSWLGEEPMSFWELQLLNMRHVQEHATQLSLFLGQHGVPDEAVDWVPRAKDEPGGS
jgi:hypothetical protein